jgi:hypothetical protein
MYRGAPDFQLARDIRNAACPKKITDRRPICGRNLTHAPFALFFDTTMEGHQGPDDISAVALVSAPSAAQIWLALRETGRTIGPSAAPEAPPLNRAGLFFFDWAKPEPGYIP